MYTHTQAAVVQLVVLGLLGEDEEQPRRDVAGVTELAEGFADPADPKVVVRRARQVVVALAEAGRALDAAGRLVGDLHAVEVEHELVGPHDAVPRLAWRRDHPLNLGDRQRLGGVVHPCAVSAVSRRARTMLADWEKPLDETMASLELAVVALSVRISLWTRMRKAC